MTDLEKLLKGMNPEKNMSEEVMTRDLSSPVEEAVVDSQLVNINDEAKSPNQMTKPELVEKEAEEQAQRTPAGQLAQQNPLGDRQSQLAEYKRLMDEYKNKLTSSPEVSPDDKVMNWLTGIGKAANIVSAAKGNKIADVEYWGDTQKKKQEASKKKDLLGLEKLQDMQRRLLELQGKSGMSELDKAKLDVEKQKLALQKKKLEQAGKKEAPLTFEQKEEIKSKMRLKEEDVKQSNKIKKENLKTRASAEKSMSDVDEQLAKVKRAKQLLKTTVQKGGLADTGPIDQYITGLGEEGQQLRQAFNDLSLAKMSKLFQGMSKAVDSDAERKMFEQSQASLGNYPSVNAQILDDMEKNLKSLKNKNKALYNRYDKKGNELELPSKVEVILPNGQRGRIDSDKVEAFKAKYPDAQILK